VLQAAAVRVLGGESFGYKVGATSTELQQRLNCQVPIYAPILRKGMRETVAAS
jgi:2-keto-4-pentenoate hydratase